METPNLILSIDEGPKKGETFDRMPGSFIRVGRVLRGNTVAIKDPGISQKHLIVEFRSEVSRWTVTDLGASNGTIVNGEAISPKAAFPLTDGDTIKIGENTLMSVKISAASSAPEPRTRRGRRVAAAVRSPIETEVMEEKVTEPAKDGEKGASQGEVCPKSANVDGANKGKPEEGKRRMPTRASAKSFSAGGPKFHEEVDVNDNKEKSTKNYQVGRVQRKKGIISAGALRNDKTLEPVVEEDCRNVTRAIELSATALKEKNVEREVGREKLEGPTKNEGKGMGKSGVKSARFLRKDAPLAPVAVEQKKGRDVKALPVISSARLVVMKDEEEQTSEKKDVLVNDGRRGRGRGKKGSGVSWKDDVLEPVLAEGRKARVTRASSMAMSRWVSKLDEGEDEEIKEKVELANNRGKQGKKGKRGGRSSGISRKGEILASVAIGETVEGCLSSALDMVGANSVGVPKDLQKKKMMAALDLNSVYLKGQENKKLIVNNNASGDGKKLSGSRKVTFCIDEAENDKEIMISGQSNKIKDPHFPCKTELTYSWSSFSEIRGIPNTTSKYREDRLINCHATPFEARVERALNRATAETSSSMDS